MSEIPYITPETNTATYLVIKGYKLLGIQYQPRLNGKQRGFFIFQASDTIAEEVTRFEKGEAAFNFTEFENEKTLLLDRVMKGLP